MVGHAKTKRKISLSDFLKEPYTELSNSKQIVCYLPSFSCPNCSELVSVQYQQNATKQIYYVRVKCSLCSYAGLGYIPYEATLSMGLPALISHVVEDLVSVDIIEQTERELERELELEQTERRLERELEHDLPF
jgi:hypothetical protein